jgi:hypothetical protein
VRVVPDIIVHRRTTKENLMVLEAKPPSSGNHYDEYARAKLRAYKTELGYRVAAFVKFPGSPREFSEDNVEFILPA